MARQRHGDAGAHAHAAARAERLKALAAEVERSAAGDTGLCEPIEAAWLAEHIGAADTHLFALRWFNPFGPTHLEFVLKAVPGRYEALLVANQRHPFTPEAWVLGLLEPSQCDDADKLLTVFRELARRRRGKAGSIVKSCPTLALLPKGGMLGWPALKDVVRAILDGIDARDLEQAISYTHRFRGQPWERATAEHADVFARFAPHFEVNGAPPAPARGGPISDELFDRWWAAITDPVHAEAEMTEFPRAWDGAIRFRRGEFSNEPAMRDAGNAVRGRGAGDRPIRDEEAV